MTDTDGINATVTLEAILPELGIDIALPATFGIPDLCEADAILPMDGLAGRPAHPRCGKGVIGMTTGAGAFKPTTTSI